MPQFRCSDCGQTFEGFSSSSPHYDCPKAKDTYPTPEHGWTCFHCGERFPGDMAGWHRARDHFGWKPNASPLCILTKEDRGLVRALRSAEHMRDKAEAALASAVAEETEACATLAENWKSSLRPGTEARLLGHQEAAREIGKAIRARIPTAERVRPADPFLQGYEAKADEGKQDRG